MRAMQLSLLPDSVPIGSTIVELIVALPVAAILGAIAVGLVLDTQRLAQRLQSTTEIARELRQASAVLSAEIRPLSANDVIAWTDTSLEIHALVGSGVICAVPSASAIDLMPLGGSDVLRASWFATPQAGDNVWTMDSDTTLMPVPVQWTMSTLHSVAPTTTSPCATRALLTRGSSVSNRPVHLTLVAAPATPARAGSLLRITQRTRYSLYRASDGQWYLGRRSLTASGWSTIQPVAGPLDTPGHQGLLVQMRDSAGTAFAFGAPRTAQSMALKLRAVSNWLRPTSKPGVVDSVLLHVALRGQSH